MLSDYNYVMNDSAFSGILLGEIENSINDRIETAYFFKDKITGKTKNTIFYDKNGDPYIKKYNKKYYLNEFLPIKQVIQ